MNTVIPMILLSLTLGAGVTAAANAIGSVEANRGSGRVAEGVDGSSRGPLKPCPKVGPKIACTTMLAISGKSPAVNGKRQPNTIPVKPRAKMPKKPTSGNPGPRTPAPSFPFGTHGSGTR